MIGIRTATGAVATALLTLGAAGSTAATTIAGAPPPTPLRPLLERVVTAGSPGALVLVGQGAGRREAATGLAVLQRSTPLHPGDRFRVGSITKTFVAVVVLQLVAANRVRLDDTIGRWLPGLVPGGERITLRHLLAHTSGLADYAADEAFLRQTASHPRRVWTPRELVRIAVRDGRVGSPGERFAYASTNYVLLGLVVERATGRSLSTVLRRQIIDPLGLSRTTFAPGGTIPGRHANGYVPSQHDGITASLATAHDRGTASASWAWAAGAIVSTAPDLSRFFDSLLRGNLLPARLVAQMLPPRGARYGLGLAAFSTPCGTVIGHTGNLLGNVSAAWASRDGRRRVIAMTNSYPLSPSADTAFRHLLEAAYCGRG